MVVAAPGAHDGEVGVDPLHARARGDADALLRLDAELDESRGEAGHLGPDLLPGDRRPVLTVGEAEGLAVSPRLHTVHELLADRHRTVLDDACILDDWGHPSTPLRPRGSAAPPRCDGRLNCVGRNPSSPPYRWVGTQVLSHAGPAYGVRRTQRRATHRAPHARRRARAARRPRAAAAAAPARWSAPGTSCRSSARGGAGR